MAGNLSETIVCRKTFDLGKIAYYGDRAINRVTIDIELRKRGGEPTFIIEHGERIPTGETTPEYLELSICGNVWNSRNTDIICGGQCLEDINKHLSKMSPKNIALFKKLLTLWREYHLNSMHAGTPEQEAFLEKYGNIRKYHDYGIACEELKLAGLYEVPYTGLAVGRRYNGEMYRYGSAWLIRELPESVVDYVKELCAA